MAMVSCKECGKEISDTAKTCINCGAKINHKKNNNKDIVIGIVILVIFVIGLSTYYITTNYSQSAHKYSKEAISVLRDYKDNKITSEKVKSEIKSLSYKANKESEEKKEDTKLYLVSLKISGIVTDMEAKILDRLDIEDYIRELKEF